MSILKVEYDNGITNRKQSLFCYSDDRGATHRVRHYYSIQVKPTKLGRPPTIVGAWRIKDGTIKNYPLGA